MKNGKSLVALTAVMSALVAGATEVYRTCNGQIVVDGAGISAGATVNWAKWQRSASPSIDLKHLADAYLMSARGGTMGSGAWRIAQGADGSIVCSNAFTLSERIEKSDFCGTRIYLAHDRWAGAAWKTDGGRTGRFPEDRKRAGLFTGDVRELELSPKDGGAAYRVAFPAPVRLHISNDSAWCDSFSLRIVKTGTIAAGERTVNVFTLSRDGGGLSCVGPHGFTVSAGTEWVPMTMRKKVSRGGVTDFSGMGFADAPAGKHGWLKRVGDHFEFEKRPGAKVKFCGANFVGTCCLPPTDEEADELIDRAIASGYNTIRLHHFDGRGCIIDDKDPAKLKFNAKRLDRFDRFVAKCIGRGLYLTIDLFSLRRPDWKAFGIDRPGDIHFMEMKANIHLTDWGFANWKAYAENLLNHVNPYTGRAYRDEPGIPLICLVNEGALTQSWKCICESPRLQEILGVDARSLRTRDNPDFERLCMDVEERSFARMKAAVRALGAKALLTDINNGPHYPLKNEFRARALDYFDNHAYVDHPQWLGERLKLPAKQRNQNLLAYAESPIEALERWRIPEMPYTVTEWNVNSPNPCRSAGGLYVGAIAAKGGWDGLWRFTWAHGIETLRDGNRRGNGFFDVMADPIMQANDRAFVALYMRGDAEGREAMVRDDERRTFVIETPRTQGGFGADGDTVKTSVLAARLAGGPATVTAIAVDGKPLAESSRILFTHLTDVQASGRTWADHNRTIITDLGKAPLLARTGRAEVALRLSRPETCEVWACETDGTRTTRIPAEVRDGGLCFTAEIVPDRPVHFVYEIVARP